jgi:hypothetical protein
MLKVNRKKFDGYCAAKIFYEDEQPGAWAGLATAL